MLIRIPQNEGYIWIFLFATLMCSINIMGFRNEVYPYQSFSSVSLCVRRDARYSVPVLLPTTFPVSDHGSGDGEELGDSGIKEVVSSSDDVVINVNRIIPVMSRNDSSVGVESVFVPTVAIGLDGNSTEVVLPGDHLNVSQLIGTAVPVVNGSRVVSEELEPSSPISSVLPSSSPSGSTSSPLSPTTVLPMGLFPTTVSPTVLPTSLLPSPSPSSSSSSSPSSSPKPPSPHHTSPPNNTKPHARRTPPKHSYPPPTIVPCSQIQFYDWRDGKDYKARCAAIQNVLLGSSSFFILQSSMQGGLGHKYISIQHSVTYALLLRRQYRIRLPEAFWSSTCSVLQPFRDDALRRHAKELSSPVCFNASPKRTNVLSVLGYRDVKLTDCRMPHEMIERSAQVNLMRRLGVMQNNENMQDFQRVLFRLLLNPTPALQSMIMEFRNTHFTKQHVFAVQMRMGGCLADSQEISEMMSHRELERLPGVIIDGMKAWNYGKGNTVIFLSSDSTYAEEYVTQALGSSFTVVTSHFFRRGHTSGEAELDSTRRALIDLYLCADADALIVCRGSGYGRIAMNMGRAKHLILYRVSHSRAANFDPRKGKCTNVTYFCGVCLEGVIHVGWFCVVYHLL